MAYATRGRGSGVRRGYFRGGMAGPFGPMAWRSDGNRFSCLEEKDDDVSSNSETEEDISDKSPSLLLRRQKKRKLNSSSGGGSRYSQVENDNENPDIDFLAMRDLPMDDRVTLILNKVCLYENRFRDITNTLDELVNANKNVAKIENVVRSHEDRIRLLEYRSIDIEARSRRNNLIFHGLAESRNENCTRLISNFIKDNFDMDVDATAINRIHRLGRYVGGGKRRPIIVAFKDYQLTENIIKQGLNLKDTGFSVSRDYPLEISRARQTLWPEYKRIKQQNPFAKISIVYPAKLIVNGRVVADLFPEWDTILGGSRIDLNHPSQELYRSKVEAGRFNVRQSTPRAAEIPLPSGRVVLNSGNANTEVTNENVTISEEDGSSQAPAHDESEVLTQPPVSETTAAPVSSADAGPVSSETSAVTDTLFKTPVQASNKSDGRGRPAAPGRPTSKSKSRSKSRSRSQARRPDTNSSKDKTNVTSKETQPPAGGTK